MSTHSNIEKVCIIITIIAVLSTVLFMNAGNLGLAATSIKTSGYEDTLFDDSYVHSIDIEIGDWDGFIQTATNEEYTAVNVTIDGETIKNVGLRAKGNTSLSTVSQLDSERYSLKLEFDAYQDNITYYGLDKLCLNNLIQDYSMMKDNITYKLMNEFGAVSPLVSYVFVTVNGEDWGLFLAVEAVEDSFLERNYGSNYGDLYKPDTLSMGGGRGNGGGFDMREVDFDKLGMSNPFENKDGNISDPFENKDGENNTQNPFEGKDGEENPSEGFGGPGESDDNKGFPGGGPGGFGMGNDASKIKYIDDDIDSYSSIFESAKTIVNYADKRRLINSIKNLSEGIAESDTDKIEEAIDVDALLRYMVVHNFVVNGDSYTGSMIHNYYLYEEDGLMSFIPWDYNLAFGTFQANNADGAVNDPIDNPLSITDGDTDRPMFSWILSNEEYTELYHEYYQSFIDDFYTSGYLENMIDTTYDMIKEYVEKDPTKFCETSEFEKAVETIRQFVLLRCKSIEGQLDGSIGSTDAEQEENPDALIDASSISLSDMGSMGGEGGPGGDDNKGGPGSDNKKGGHKDRSRNSKEGDEKGQNNSTDEEKNNNSEDGFNPEEFDFGSQGGPPDFGGGEFEVSNSIPVKNYVYLGISVISLVAAAIFALKYKGRR